MARKLVPIDLDLAAALLRQREAKGLKANWVAHKIGVSSAYLCDLEHGRRRWTERLLKAFRAIVES